jgi:translation initiation factor 5
VCLDNDADPTKFFGCELGAQTPMDEKNDKYIVNGAHEAVRLRELLDVFIDKFVLCGSCKNPETDLIVEKSGDYIYRDCKACGKKSDIDMRHKLSTYIVRNPPKTAKGKKSRGAHATANTNGGTGTPGSGSEGKGSGEDDDGEDAFTKKLKSEAAVLPTAEQVGVDENDWSLDTSADAVRARAKLEAAMGSLTLGDDDENEDDDADSPYTKLKVWATENRASANAVEVYKKAQELGIEKKHKSLQVLARYLFTQEMLNQLSTFTPLFKKVSPSKLCARAASGLLLSPLPVPRYFPSPCVISFICFHQCTLRAPVVGVSTRQAGSSVDLIACFVEFSDVDCSAPPFLFSNSNRW